MQCNIAFTPTLYHKRGEMQAAGQDWNIPTFEKRSRTLGEPGAIFAGFEGFAANILAFDYAESPREQLEDLSGTFPLNAHCSHA